MLNIPVISIVIFLAILIPSFFIGYFRGWKSSLFISVVVLAFMGAFVGLAIGLYDQAWWPLFRGMFVDDAMNSNLNVEAFKEIAEPTVVGIIAMITIPFAYGGAVCLHIPFKDKLKRSLYPKVKPNKDKPEEFKVTKTRVIPQRVAGVVISGSTGLLMASTVAAGVQSLVEPTAKNNFLTDITKSLSKVYTFGQGGYDTAYQVAYEYLPRTNDGKVNSAFTALWAINPSDIRSLTNLESGLETYFADPAFREEIDRLASQPEAFITILESFDVDESPRQFWVRPQGSAEGIEDGANNGNIEFWNTFDTAVSNIHLGLNFSDELDQMIIDSISSNITEFEKSSYYKAWSDAKELLRQAYVRLDELNAELQGIKNRLGDLRAQLRREENKLVQMQDELAILKGTGLGSISAANVELQRLQGLASTALSNYNTYNTNTFIPSQTQLGNLSSDVTSARSIYDSAKGDADFKKNQYDTLVGQRTQLINQRDTSQRTVDNLGREITSIDSQIQAKTTTRDSLQTKLDGYTLEKSDAETTKATKELQRQDKQDELDTNAQLTESEKQTLRNQIATLTNEINALTNKITSLSSSISSTSTQIQTLGNEISGLQQTRSQKSTQQQSARDEVTRLNGEIASKDGDIASAKTAMDAAAALAQQKLTILQAAERAYNNFNINDFIPKQRENDRLFGLKSSAESAVTRQEGVVNQLEDKKKLLEGGPTETGSIAWQGVQIQNVKDAIQTAEGEQSRVEGEINTQHNRITELTTGPQGEETLREIRDDQREQYDRNIARYQEGIRTILNS